MSDKNKKQIGIDEEKKKVDHDELSTKIEEESTLKKEEVEEYKEDEKMKKEPVGVEESEKVDNLLSDEEKVIHKKITDSPFKDYLQKIKNKVLNGCKKIALIVGLDKRGKNKYSLKFVLVGVVIVLVGVVLFQSLRDYSINQGDTPKYVVDQFITKLRINLERTSSGEKNMFPRGKKVQLYGPIVRIKDKVVYMRAEDCMLEISMSSKKEIMHVILGKQYKIEATIFDVAGVDEEIYLKKGVFLEPLPSSIRQ